MRNKKQGISLITLVITIIIMIILAGTVILTLSNTDITKKANTAVELTNETVKYYKNIWLANKSETSYVIYLNALHNALKETEDEYNVEFAI